MMLVCNRRNFTVALFVLVAGGCSDSITAPEPHRNHPTRSYDSEGEPLPPYASQAEMPAQANSMLTYPWTQFGEYYSELTLVEVTVSGLIDAVYGPNEDRFGEDVGKLWQVLDPGGWANASYSCGMFVEVRFTLNTTSSGIASFCDGVNTNPLQETRKDTVLAKGYPRMFRQKGPYLDDCNNPTYGPCFTFTGTQTITVTPIADKLRLVASASEVEAGDSVTFAASTSNGSALTIREWIWIEDPSSNPPVVRRSNVSSGVSLRTRRPDGEPRPSFDGGAGQQSCVTTSNACTISVLRSGTMYVRAWVVNKSE